MRRQLYTPLSYVMRPEHHSFLFRQESKVAMGRKLEIGLDVLQEHGGMEGSASRFNPVESHGQDQRRSH